jgi:hypothetical protein
MSFGLDVNCRCRPLERTTDDLDRLGGSQVRSHLEPRAILFQGLRPNRVVDCRLEGGLEDRELGVAGYLVGDECALGVHGSQF